MLRKALVVIICSLALPLWASEDSKHVTAATASMAHVSTLAKVDNDEQNRRNFAAIYYGLKGLNSPAKIAGLDADPFIFNNNTNFSSDICRMILEYLVGRTEIKNVSSMIRRTCRTEVDQLVRIGQTNILASIWNDEEDDICLWRIDNGQIIDRTLQLGYSHMPSMKFDQRNYGRSYLHSIPNTNTLAAATDKQIRIWHVDTKNFNAKITANFKGHKERINALTSIAGKVLVSASRDTSIKLWKLESLSENNTLVGHTKAVTALAHIPDTPYLLSGSEDETIKVWHIDITDFTKSQNIATFVSTGGPIRHLAWFHNRLACACNDGIIQIFDVESKTPCIDSKAPTRLTPIARLTHNDAELFSLVPIPDENLLISVTRGWSHDQGSIKFWSIGDSKNTNPVLEINQDTFATYTVKCPYFHKIYKARGKPVICPLPKPNLCALAVVQNTDYDSGNDTLQLWTTPLDMLKEDESPATSDPV